MTDSPRTALIVGGSGDIGGAIAARLGHLSYRVVITGRDPNRLESAVDGLRAAGVDATGLVCDLTDQHSIARLWDEFVASHGHLDVLINAAGVSEPRLLVKADEDHLLHALRVNLVGPALVARHALAQMRKARRGTIVNIASMAGVVGRKGFGAYGASKGGLIALTDSLREEAARFGVRVATICPEKVDTRMHGEDPGRSKMIRPADVAEAVVFLLQLSPNAIVRELRIHAVDEGGPAAPRGSSGVINT